MKRITTMQLDIVTEKNKNCENKCLFISHLHNKKIRLAKQRRVRERYAKKYTQLVFMITPHHLEDIPKEIQSSVEAFHNDLSEIDFGQDREKTVKLIKFIIFELNKTVMDWNHAHKSEKPVRLNLTILFVYGDHLIMFNFGSNLVYIYRDGDLATFKGSRLDNEKHFSLKPGREGKIEYMLFEKSVPPIGEVDFETNQISALFRITHRLLKGDLLAVLSEDSIIQDQFRVNVNLYEHSIEKTQMLKLIGQSQNKTVPGYAWILLSFEEVREFRQTVRYTIFNTFKGLASFALLLTSLLAPIIYHQQVHIDNIPVQVFDTPPTTAHITLISAEQDFSIDLIPSISGTPSQTETSEKEGLPSIKASQSFSKAIESGLFEDLGAYYPAMVDMDFLVSLPKESNLLVETAKHYYGNAYDGVLIELLNPTIDNKSIFSDMVLLPVYTVPFMESQTLADISKKHYGTGGHIKYLMAVNGLETEDIPEGMSITVPPLYIYPTVK